MQSETYKGGRVSREAGVGGLTSLRRRGVLGLAVLCAALAGSLLAVAPAGAKTIEPYVYSGHSFNGSGSTAGSFEKPSYIAVNKATGGVYVMDGGHGGVLDQFDESGAAVPFTDPSLSGGSSISLGTWFSGSTNLEADVAVDNSGTSTQGSIFALRNSPETIPLLYGFKPSGAPLGPNWPVCGVSCGKLENFYGPHGMATDPNGTPWVANTPFYGTPPRALNPIDPATGGRPPGQEPILIGQLCSNLRGTACFTAQTTAMEPYRLAFDAGGNIYVVATPIKGCPCSPVVMKYSQSGKLLNPTITPQVHGVATSFTGFQIDVQLAIDTSSNRLLVDFGDHVEVYSLSGEQIGSFGSGVLTKSTGLAVNPTTHKAYVTNTTAKTVDIYEPGPPVTVPNVTTKAATGINQESATLSGTVDPDNGGNTTECFFQYGRSSMNLTSTVPCAQGNSLPSAGGPQTVTATLTELNCQIAGLCSLLPTVTGVNFFYRVVTKNAAGPQQTGAIMSFRNANKPALGIPSIRNVNSDSADLGLKVFPEGGETNYRIKVGTTTAYERTISRELPVPYSGRPELPEEVTVHIGELAPDTTYHYEVIAENLVGEVETTDRTFHTFAKPTFEETCPNALSRQQTSAAQLLDCRSYELVSAADQGGYNVESDLAPGQTPYAGYPDAPGKVLYAVHSGGIPNSGSPTNRGPDPYVATRGTTGWSTKYVGIPASPSPSLSPFSSTVAGAGAGLEAFAFSGPSICAPCFNDGSAGIQLRLPNGELVQGMVGSEHVINPTPAGTVAKPLSADGSHFIFGSTQKFESDGNSGEISIYDRSLAPGGATHVVSKTPLGATMSGPASGVGSIAELDVSKDGSRILLGQLVSTDAKGNSYYHLYMNVGDASKTIDLMPGSSTGALYDGMTSDGSNVFFTSKDQLASDGDASADLYEAEVGSESSTLSRISTGIEGTGNIDACTPASNWNTVSGGPNCDIVAIAGGGGVAAKDGSVFFLSPEKLDGLSKGTAGQPNLYTARPGSPPHYITTLEITNPIVKHGVEAAGTRNTADFQVNPNGNDAAFTTALSLKPGFENRGFSEVYRYDAFEDQALCVSCDPSNAPAVGKASLASNGLSLTEDGRVFFNSLDPLVLSDTNDQQDAYEWEEGTVDLISSGINENASSVLSAGSDGTDVYFFTHEKLAPQDENGPVVKIYDAREEGGFFVSPSKQPCKASDECHGAGTVPAPVPEIQSTQGTNGQVAEEKSPRCKKRFVRKNGKCVKKHPKHHRHSTRRHG
jgi:hypothetical protein